MKAMNNFSSGLEKSSKNLIDSIKFDQHWQQEEPSTHRVSLLRAEFPSGQIAKLKRQSKKQDFFRTLQTHLIWKLACFGLLPWISSLKAMIFPFGFISSFICFRESDSQQFMIQQLILLLLYWMMLARKIASVVSRFSSSN